MAETSPPFKPSNVAEANTQFATGQKYFSNGDFDTALTWYRRAALNDPNFFAAQMEIGRLCRDKAKLDKMFLRYAYEAFHKAAGLDLANEDAHNQFILTGSQLARLEEMLLAYDKWLDADPANDMLQRCKRNVVTISMAMIPQNVGMEGNEAQGIKRVILVGSILMVVLGLAVLGATPLLLKSGKLQRSQVRGVVPTGIAISVIGVAGFLGRRLF